jgi:hypothetical protein
MSSRRIRTETVRARRPDGSENTKVRLSVTQAEDRNAPGSLLALLNPLTDFATVAPPAAGATPGAFAPPVITVTLPKTPTPAEPLVLQRPPAEPTAASSPVARQAVRVGDPFLTDILWDPGTTAQSVYLGEPGEPTKGLRRPGGDDSAAATGPSAGPRTPSAAVPGVGFGSDPRGAAPLPGGGTGFDGRVNAPPKDGVGSGTGSGYGVTSGSSSGGAGDLDIIASDGTVYADAKEETHGGWVAVNNDNDNYNFDAVLPTQHVLDLAENAKVDRENDLIAIKVTSVTPGADPNGKFTVEWTSPKITIYNTADKNGAFASGSKVVVGQTLYVEGQSLSTSAGDVSITLGWVPLGGGRQLVDTVKFTVYEVAGAMNVPGYSEPTYSIRTPDGRVSAIGVRTDVAGGGTNNPTTVVDPSTFTTSRKILWDGGPVFGKYRATPVVGEPFWADREVNVVRVEFTTTGGPNNRLVLNNFPIQDPANRARILSHATVAMTADLRVTTIDGPALTPGGMMRGVKFIEMGFIQHVKADLLNAEYNDLVIPKRLRSEFQDGKYHLDTVTDPWLNRPWYDKANQPHVGTRSYYLAAADPVAPITNVDFNTSDTPKVLGTDPDQFDIDLDIGGEDRVDKFNMVFDFTLSFVVHTRDYSRVSDDYTQRGFAFWQFDGSGTIDKTGKWTLSDSSSGNSSLVPRFRPTTDGRTVDVPARLWDNENVAVWKINNSEWVLEDL